MRTSHERTDRESEEQCPETVLVVVVCEVVRDFMQISWDCSGSMH
jgi:hypothetical protein